MSGARRAFLILGLGTALSLFACSPTRNDCYCPSSMICCEGTGACASSPEQCDQAGGDANVQVSGDSARPGDTDPPIPEPIDILMVIDNSRDTSFLRPHVELTLRGIIGGLTAYNFDYRIGMVSTDTEGFSVDCCGESLPEPGSRGDCSSCDCVDGCYGCVPCEPRVELRRPHDGARGRLIAAYDPEAYDVALHPELSSTLQSVLAGMFPTSVLAVPWAIDFASLRSEACAACGCPSCSPLDACFGDCATPVATELALAHGRSNLVGLGTDGLGWEQGLLAASLAIGIDPGQANDAAAIDPGSGLLDTNGANQILVYTATGVIESEPWLRPGAPLAILFFSNEDDCSMSAGLFASRHLYEQNAGEPGGSICYQSGLEGGMHSVSRMAHLVDLASDGEVMVGYLGSALLDAGGDCWSAADCATATPAVEPITDCACLAGSDDLGWCAYTTNIDTSGSLPACDSLAGERYVEFAKTFTRHAVGSCCAPPDTTLVELVLGKPISAAVCE